VDKCYFAFLPQGQSGFPNFQVQVNNVFSLTKDKKKKSFVFADILLFLHGYFV
jgi:hypothetical protein